jgi:hypothetical protein
LAGGGADLTSPDGKERGAGKGEVWIGSSGCWLAYLQGGRAAIEETLVCLSYPIPLVIYFFEEKEEGSGGARSISSWPKRSHSTST